MGQIVIFESFAGILGVGGFLYSLRKNWDRNLSWETSMLSVLASGQGSESLHGGC